MIRVKNISKKFANGSLALKHLSFEIDQGEFVYLVGPNGAGKTTLLKLLFKEESVSSGSIQVGNVLLEQLNSSQLYLLRRQLGIIAQEDIFLPMTAYKNLAYCLAAIGISVQERKERILQALEMVGMSDYQEVHPSEMSVGQRKKLGIARAIASRPAILIADEPTANLDSRSAMEIMKLFLRINQTKTTVLLATHDSAMVNTLKQRVLELREGVLIRDEKNGSYSKFSDPKDMYVW